MANSTKTIFIVDDQEAIRDTTTAILEDEGYKVQTFSSAETLQEALTNFCPDLVLLDIWLPGVDGVEALSSLLEAHPQLPIILMSGHAGIDVAVNAMQAGAADFLEKPINLDTLLDKVAKYLKVAGDTIAGSGIASIAPSANLKKGEIASLDMSDQPQRTVKMNAVLNGVGLLSGRPTGVIIKPAPIDTGIVFRTLDGIAIHSYITNLENFDQIGQNASQSFTANSTVLSKSGRRIRTVEHLLAALNMMGITNASIIVDEEIPNVDGSAADFCRILEEAGIEDQAKQRHEIVIHKKISIGNEVKAEKYLYIEPYDGFEVKLRIDFPAPIYEQEFHFCADKHSFAKEIAPARSFNTFENIDSAQKSGAVGSGYLNSHIIIHDGEVINTKLLFPDEFVRHKILDLLGDLYLLGVGLRGRVVGNMTSHGLNQELAKKIHLALNIL